MGVEGIKDIRLEMRDGRYNSQYKKHDSESERVIKQINDFGTDLLLVAFGAPWQERWLIEHRSELNTKVAMVVGGALDMWAGNVRRAPLGWRKIGLEWLWRLMMEPSRFKRQLRLVKFMGMVCFG